MIAANRSPRLRLTSTGSLRQSTRPVAAKLLEIAGHASDISTSASVSAMPRRSSRTKMVPSATRISENDSLRSVRFASGFRLRERVSTSADQLERPWVSNVTAMRGRISATSAISMRPSSSGSSRSCTISRSADSAASPPCSSPSTTWPRITRAEGNSETVASPSSTGSSPVTARISACTVSRTWSAGMNRGTSASAPMPAAITAAIPTPSRFKPLAAITGGFRRWDRDAPALGLRPRQPAMARELGVALCRIHGRCHFSASGKSLVPTRRAPGVRGWKRPGIGYGRAGDGTVELHGSPGARSA